MTTAPGAGAPSRRRCRQRRRRAAGRGSASLGRACRDALARALEALYARVPLGMRLGLERDACSMHACRAPRARLRGRARRRHERQGLDLRDGRVDRARRAARRPASTPRRTSVGSPSASASTASRSRTRRSPTCSSARSTSGPELSFFETATLAAFLAFRDARGRSRDHRGRHRRPARRHERRPAERLAVAAITRVALDHIDRLGDTLEAIAREKAGIAKGGRAARARPHGARGARGSARRRARRRRAPDRDGRGPGRRHA